MKTLIELYDKCQINNVVAGLSFHPEKIIFVGFRQTMKSSHKKSLENFFRMKNVEVSIEYEYVSRYDYDSIVTALSFIVDSNEDCCFDLTGGKELVLVAMGAISASKKVPMVQFDVKTGDLIRVSNCENIAEPDMENISIEEIVTLNGGAVVSGASYTHRWNLTGDFRRDIKQIWEICRMDSAGWNSNAIALSTLEKRDIISSDLYVKGYINSTGNAKLNPFIMEKLDKAGLIEEFSLKGGFVAFRYKNSQVREAVTKSGNSLELLIYMLAQEVTEENPGFYTDSDVGVVVDWDGVIHNDFIDGRDTRNEIDVILMRRHNPVFISCKNGAVPKEALYELQAVSEKFGGEYVKKVLVTTYISKNASARNFILQRARDMNIEIISGVEKMTTEEIKKALYNRAR